MHKLTDQQIWLKKSAFSFWAIFSHSRIRNRRLSLLHLLRSNFLLQFTSKLRHNQAFLSINIRENWNWFLYLSSMLYAKRFKDFQLFTNLQQLNLSWMNSLGLFTSSLIFSKDSNRRSSKKKNYNEALAKGSHERTWSRRCHLRVFFINRDFAIFYLYSRLSSIHSYAETTTRGINRGRSSLRQWHWLHQGITKENST